MRLVERSATTDIPADAIWNTLATMEWQDWDPDVAAMENTEQGLQEDATFTYVLNNGLRFPSHIFGVTDGQAFSWSGSAMAGLMGYWGRISIEPSDAGTQITYQFKMTRLFGWFVDLRYRDLVVHGVEEGLRGIIRNAKP
ncbi:MAG: SRPBCC family protein [Pseudomonadota bacterium]